MATSGEKPWEFSFMLYGWVPGISADVDSGEASDHVSNAPINIMDDLNGAIMVHAEVSKQPFTLIADFLYVSFEDDSVGPSGGSGFSLEGSILDLAATMRAGEWSIGKDGTIAIDPLVGARWCDLDIGLDLGPLEGSKSKQWIDPVVGARVIADLDEHWRFLVRGDLGGFGVGTEFTWFVDASVSYTFVHGIFATLGYRALYLDFDDGSGDDRAKITGILHGPYIGVGVRF
jgi:hypothetical protein